MSNAIQHFGPSPRMRGTLAIVLCKMESSGFCPLTWGEPPEGLSTMPQLGSGFCLPSAAGMP